MVLLEIIKRKFYYVWSVKPTELELYTQQRTLQVLLPSLIFITGFISFVVLPVRFGFWTAVTTIDNFKISITLFSILTLNYIFLKLVGGTKTAVPVVLTFFAIGVFGLFNENVMQETPFVPFYAQILSIIVAASVFNLRQLGAYIVFFIFSYAILITTSPIESGLFLHRSAILFFALPFCYFESYIRHVNYVNLEEKTTDLLKNSNVQVLAELSGNIAHEINNPLMIVSGQAQAIIYKLKNEQDISDEDLLYRLEKINNTAMRISTVVSGLKRFSRSPDNLMMETLSLKSVFEDAESIYNLSLKQKHIQLEMCGVSDDLQVFGLPVQLSQVFINLISNSIDAIDGLDNPYIRIDCKKFKDRIEIEFSDSGPGIPQDKVNDVIKPFYTTKKSGKGTGLGLNLCKNIIISHNGQFKVVPIRDKFFFKICLPLAKAQKKAA